MNEKGDRGKGGSEREMGKQSVASISRHKHYSLKWLPLATMEMHFAQWNCILKAATRSSPKFC